MELNKQKFLFLNNNTFMSFSFQLHSFVNGNGNNNDNSNNSLIFKTNYNKFSQCIALYLTIFQKLIRLTIKEFQKFKNYALYFRILDKYFFQQNSKNILCYQVIDNKQNR